LDAGGIIIELLAEIGTRQNLDGWISTYDIRVTAMRDPDAMVNQSINALVRREYNYIVDLTTMRIVAVDIGSTGSAPTNSAQVGMMKMLQLLGPTGG
jgi:hypothetical protein